MKTAPGQAHKESIARAQAAGREARTSLPRRDFAALTLPERDPVGILEGQHATRLADLIPVRVGRMLQTPFSFYRGAAAVMAHDLADSPVTGHTLIASGDAHLANFGLFASPERRLIFDLNDFDEAYPAPWEWDIKRLGAGIWLNGRISSHTEEQCGTAVRACVRSYREALKARSTLRSDTSLLLSQYHLVDFARRIVGVGSVGTRSWVLRFEGPAGEPLFLQAKEAGKSVLATHGRVHLPAELVEKALITRGQGYRVVGAQRILQAQSDPFLGWVKDVTGDDGLQRDFYIRQFRDMKGSFTLAEMNSQETTGYGRLCGGLLARAHSQSTGSAFILGYLGGSDAFDDALADWARNYADQTEADHAALEQAVQSGRLPAERGV